MHSAFVFLVALQHYACTLLWPSLVFVKKLCTRLMLVLRQEACISRWDIWMDIDLYAYRKAHMACIYIMLCLFAHSERYETCYKQNQPQENQTTVKEPWKIYLVTPVILSVAAAEACAEHQTNIWHMASVLFFSPYKSPPHISGCISSSTAVAQALWHLQVLTIKNILIDHGKIWQKCLVCS